MPPCEVSGMDRCHNCRQEFLEIENDRLRLTGCLTCNLWAPVEGDRWCSYLKKISARFISCVMGGSGRTPKSEGEIAMKPIAKKSGNAIATAVATLIFTAAVPVGVAHADAKGQVHRR